jgi:hypothetical protein
MSRLDHSLAWAARCLPNPGRPSVIDTARRTGVRGCITGQSRFHPRDFGHKGTDAVHKRPKLNALARLLHVRGLGTPPSGRRGVRSAVRCAAGALRKASGAARAGSSPTAGFDMPTQKAVTGPPKPPSGV